MSAIAAPGAVMAVLGPTNTGKTHYAIERMLAHRDGMIGLPLRLLAREVYERVVKAKGANAVALVTGEEKIWPDHARYYVCTVEAMPLDRVVEFLAIDEIQLARDPDRGYIFTDRLLHARGTGETLLLGSDTMRQMLRRVIGPHEVLRRERLSTLSYAGARKLTKLARRTAIVAFSAEEVYAIAELIRRQKGGAAIVMGALSPRTRNAQVALYQSGEVDYLVATDAIGMGLNMDVDHVVFASRAKFDGRRQRNLRADEIAQIAGRAGRYRDDGDFGETGDCAPLDAETIERVESHEFEPVEAIEWRSRALEFQTLSTLMKSLEQPAPAPGLVRARGALDEETLKRLAQDESLRDRLTRPADIRRLWDVCMTPDFRKATIDEHTRLVGALANALIGGRQRIPQDWIARELGALDRVEGDIDALQGRLAHVRTWTYVANRPDWLNDCEHWRGRAREIEDRLSDSLHSALTQRFIDRRTSALVRGLRREDALLAAVSDDGEVSVEGHYVGRLDGLDFRADPRAEGQEGKALRNAAARALAPEIFQRLRAITAAEDDAFNLDELGRIHWRDSQGRAAAVARLVGGGAVLKPKIALLAGEIADATAANAARLRIEAWAFGHIDAVLAPLAGLVAASTDPALSANVRGLAFRLVERFGALDRGDAASLIDGLGAHERALLKKQLGVMLGIHCVYAPGLLAPAQLKLLAVLRHWAGPAPDGRARFAPRAAWFAPPPDMDDADLAAIGFRRAGAAAVRLDRVERFAAAARAGADPQRRFVLTPALAGQLGVAREWRARVLHALGYRAAGEAAADGHPVWRLPSPRAPRPQPVAPSGPFAALARLAQPPPPDPPSKRRRRKRKPKPRPEPEPAP
jgi:ATP-dependent RNA helicase SUPV3L1/SUV3